MKATMLKGNWNYPTSMKFGPGRIKELPDLCKAYGLKKPLLVTDPGLAKLPMIIDAVAANEAAGIPTAVFSDVKPNPTGKNVADGVAAYRAGGHDSVIAFGGGSPLDAGKAVAFHAGQSRPLWDFEDIGDWWTRADASKIAPVIAIPTTAGTGSEVGRAGVITDEDAHVKRIIFHPKMLPVVVIADPELTVGLPPHVTAATGMDALAHCLEALCAPGFHPMADGIALEGIRLIRDWLPVAVKDGRNIEARSNMLVAASMGATAFQKGLGSIHSLAHPLGALYDAHHGLLNGILMPYCMAHNRDAIEDKMVRLGRYVGMSKPGFDSALIWVLDLRREIGIPHTLKDIGIGDNRAEEIGRMAEADPSTGGNAKPVDADGLRAVFVDAVNGRL
jgi:alcohol dehydrogenase class IV